MERIGVFVCHCGTNIAGTVDVEKVAEELDCKINTSEKINIQLPMEEINRWKNQFVM